MTLPNTLRINAISSGITGVLLLFQSRLSASLFGWNSHLPFLLTGLFLVLFASYVLYQSRRVLKNPGSVRLIIGMDSLWVLASVCVLILFHSRLTTFGSLAIGLVGLWVALMVFLQYRAFIRGRLQGNKHRAGTT